MQLLKKKMLHHSRQNEEVSFFRGLQKVKKSDLPILIRLTLSMHKKALSKSRMNMNGSPKTIANCFTRRSYASTKVAQELRKKFVCLSD